MDNIHLWGTQGSPKDNINLQKIILFIIPKQL